ncbi:MAG: potassium transporter [Desulfobacca sp. 4484_104]|nr:MAG: potassium transporter [Desulfobacca sp. 4484_104]RLA89323.1 MAG: sodium:proton antiporter [Deltaproteobacteria bacterium]
MAFSLAVIIVLGLAADYLFRQIKLPGLVGMLIVGILAGPYVFNLLDPAMMAVSADFRKLALIVILLRAGFELRRDTLHRTARPALLLSAVPALLEIAGVIIIAPTLLDLTWMEAAILGSILGAVSPAVVVPLMINFMDRGKGDKKGIPTLILAASSIDDVFVIVIFTILLGMYGGQQINLAWQLGSIPISIVLGIIIGLIPGYILYKLFLRYELAPPRKTILIMGVAIVLTWIEDLAHRFLPIASLLGVMAIGFIILEKEEAMAHIISQKLKKLWVFAELLLFVLVGAQVNIQVAWDAGLAGLAVIAFGLVWRSVGSYLSVLGAGLNWKEKLFCVVSYIPKATVQAAIGAIPLEAGVAGGEVILAIAVLSILVTAPIGAIGIMLMGEPILEEEEKSIYRFKPLRDMLQLPRVGQRVRNKQDGTVWKVIEEKEIWLEEQTVDGPQPIPAIYLRFWKPQEGQRLGTGKTIRSNYTATGPSFHDYWEIMPD